MKVGSHSSTSLSVRSGARLSNSTKGQGKQVDSRYDLALSSLEPFVPQYVMQPSRDGEDRLRCVRRKSIGVTRKSASNWPTHPGTHRPGLPCCTWRRSGCVWRKMLKLKNQKRLAKSVFDPSRPP